MGVGTGLYMYDVVIKNSRSLSHLLMSSCCSLTKTHLQRPRRDPHRMTVSTHPSTKKKDVAT